MQEANNTEIEEIWKQSKFLFPVYEKIDLICTELFKLPESVVSGPVFISLVTRLLPREGN